MNHMVQYLTKLDGTFSALSDPTRRAILERLGQGSATISELAGPNGMSLTGLKKHVRILEEAELVTTEKRGRARHCRLGPKRLDDASDWIEGYRRRAEERFGRLDELLERRQKGASTGPTTHRTRPRSPPRVTPRSALSGSSTPLASWYGRRTPTPSC